MIRAIVFDLNGVFIQSPLLSDRFEQSFGISSKQFLSALKEIMGIVRMPHAQDAFSYWQPYFKKWKVDLDRKEFYEFWFSAEKEVPEMVNYAKEMKRKGLSLYIVSNNFRERADYYAQHFSILNELFDHVYYSWQTGFAKPSPKAFEKLLNDRHQKPSECIYFDDSVSNVAVAQQLGIKAHLFTGVENTKKVISEELKNDQ